MEQLYGWIRNLAGYFVFLAVLEQLMSGSRSGRYVRFFAGVILILLVLKPLTGGLHLEDVLVREYEALLFQYDTRDLRQEISGAENQRLEWIMDQYELAVAQTVEELARAEGYKVYGCVAVIQRDKGSDRFGEVVEIQLSVGSQDNVGYDDSERLKKKVAVCYDLEEEHVEIQIVEREG